MKRIEAGKFKDERLVLLDRLDREGIIVTKDGKPIARVVPVRGESGRLIGLMRGKIKIKGDVFSTGVKWNPETRKSKVVPLTAI